MKKYSSSERKVDLYDIGDGLTLMNVIMKNKEGKVAAIFTYIGDHNDFSCVARAEDIDNPGAVFSYAKYNRMLEANMSFLLENYNINTNSLHKLYGNK